MASLRTIATALGVLLVSACGDDDREPVTMIDAGVDAGPDAGPTDVCGVTAPAGTVAFTWGEAGMTQPESLDIVTCTVTMGGDYLIDSSNESGAGAMSFRIQLSGYDGAGTYEGTQPEGVRVEVIDAMGRTVVNATEPCTVCVNEDARSGTFSCTKLEIFDGTGAPHAGSYRCP